MLLFFYFCVIIFLIILEERILIKMELFKNTTIYSEKIYQKFLAFHTKEYRFSYQIYTAIICLGLLFCLIMQVSYHYYFSAICFVIILVCFFLWRFFHPVTSTQKEAKTDKYQNQAYTFLFYEKSMEIDTSTSIITISYSHLYKIFETNEFFYFYVDKKHAFLIDKTGFENNSSLAFSNFIQKECKRIYKNRRES